MKHILVVDDSSTVRMYHRGMLESAGYTVDEAINGIEALEKALNAAYDLFLVDLNMPRLDGYSFIRELRGQKAMPQMPAVMISTEAKPADQTRAFEAGANLYLIKPTRPDVLLPFVRLLLGETGP